MTDERRSVEASRQIDVTDANEGVTDLFSRLSNQFSRLMRQEVALAKTELKQEATKAGKAGGLLGGAAFAGYMTVVLLSFAAVAGLAALMPWGLAFLAIGILWGLVAAVLGLSGKKQAQQVDPTPHATIDTLQDDARWAKEQPGKGSARTLR